MELTSQVSKSVVERIVKDVVTVRTYTLTLTREELNLLRGLHFRLHNSSVKGREILDKFTPGHAGWVATDGPSNYDLYHDFLSRVWHESNKYNGEN